MEISERPEAWRVRLEEKVKLPWLLPVAPAGTGQPPSSPKLASKEYAASHVAPSFRFLCNHTIGDLFRASRAMENRVDAIAKQARDIGVGKHHRPAGREQLRQLSRKPQVLEGVVLSRLDEYVRQGEQSRDVLPGKRAKVGDRRPSGAGHSAWQRRSFGWQSASAWCVSSGGRESGSIRQWVHELTISIWRADRNQ